MIRGFSFIFAPQPGFMIRLFKSLNPINILWLAVILAALRASYLFNVPAAGVMSFSAPLGKSLSAPFIALSQLSPHIDILIAGAVVFVQALILNYLANHFNLLGRPTFLPALMYVALTSLFPPFLFFTPPLLCNFLLLWMLFKMFRLYKSADAKASCFDLGMIVAVGTMLYLPFIFLFAAIWMALILFKPFAWRDWTSGIAGFITVFFFVAVYYYWNNRLGQFFTIWQPLATRFPIKISINYYNYIVLVPVLIILALGLFRIQQNFRKSVVQVRKSVQLLLGVFFVCSITFYTQAAFRLEHFLLCAVPCTVFFAYYFLYAPRKWLSEALFLLLLAGIIYFQFNTF